MAHRLVPREGHGYLAPRVVVGRLLSVVPYVASSEEYGRRYVRGLIEQLHAIKQRGDIPVDSAYLDRLERVRNGAVYVYFSDGTSETAYLSTTVIPEEPIFFDYSSSAHEQAARALLLQCAAALDYEIFDV